MAFSTIQGSGGAPDSFVGTSGVDSIVVVNSDGNYFLGAEPAADNITLQTTANPLYGGVVSNATMKGGQGADTFTFNTAANVNTFYSSAWINGNADRDTLTFNAADTFLVSTIHGGAANDTITLASALTSSLVNGNKGVDTIEVTGALNASTIYGGGGNDIIDMTGNATAAADSVISGDLGNDTITAVTGGGAANTADGSSIFGGQGVDTIDARAFGVADDEIFINGNQGDDTITASTAADQQIFGGEGSDTITATAATGATTITGGTGGDTIALNNAFAGADRVNYSAIGQGGTSASATSTATVASTGFDVITNFTVADDTLNFEAASLSGVASAAAAGAANAWNLDNAGVFISTTPFAAAATFAAVGTRIGQVTGDAGDTGYFAFLTTATDYTIAQVTLGTDKAAEALNAGDQISILGTVDASAVLTTANISFVG